ncbi:MAG TPA: hypothetical protein VIQ30_10260 [Pseudonocardia sp.]
MRTPTLNRERIALLSDVHSGWVYRTVRGEDVLLTAPCPGQPVGRKLRELAEAGWVELAEGGRFHTLTEAGVKALAAVQP